MASGLLPPRDSRSTDAPITLGPPVWDGVDSVVRHVAVRLKIDPDLDDSASGIRNLELKPTRIGMAGRERV